MMGAKRRRWTEDERDAVSAAQEDAECGDREAEMATHAQEFAVLLSMLHRHLLRHNIHEQMWDQPNGRKLFHSLEAAVELIDRIG